MPIVKQVKWKCRYADERKLLNEHRWRLFKVVNSFPNCSFKKEFVESKSKKEMHNQIRKRRREKKADEERREKEKWRVKRGRNVKSKTMKRIKMKKVHGWSEKEERKNERMRL